jgi:hypothetical protein
MHHLRHPPIQPPLIQHPLIRYLQYQHVLHQCRLLHQYCRLPTQTNKNYQGITPHLMLIHPAAIQQCHYPPSRSTTKCLFRNQTIRRISMAVLQPQPLLTYYPTARGISVSCVALPFGTIWCISTRILQPSSPYALNSSIPHTSPFSGAKASLSGIPCSQSCCERNFNCVLSDLFRGILNYTVYHFVHPQNPHSV